MTRRFFRNLRMKSKKSVKLSTSLIYSWSGATSVSELSTLRVRTCSLQTSTATYPISTTKRGMWSMIRWFSMSTGQSKSREFNKRPVPVAWSISRKAEGELICRCTMEISIRSVKGWRKRQTILKISLCSWMSHTGTSQPLSKTWTWGIPRIFTDAWGDSCRPYLLSRAVDPVKYHH